MTQVFLQDAIVDDLKNLFQHKTLVNSMGIERALNIYEQELPIREGDDEETDPEASPEPYILVRMPGGEVPEQDAQQDVEIVLVICVFDPDPNRKGYRDALHIVNAILQHYATDGVVGKRYTVKHPIRWATQEEDTHPYYFAAMSLHFEAPAIYREVPQT